jgi:CheY-like chemotaxis protein
MMTVPGIGQQLSRKRILVAEDEPLVACTLRMVAVVDGHVVDTAEDRRQALAIFDGGT